jgi:uncharacterized membrane protein
MKGAHDSLDMENVWGFSLFINEREREREKTTICVNIRIACLRE